MHVDNSESFNNTYDMIIGRDLMHELGLIFNFTEGRIYWDNAWINMQDPAHFTIGDVDEFEKELFFAHDPETTEAERIQRIMDLKYAPADLEAEVQKCALLNGEEKNMLLNVLKKYESLFDGELGHWKTEPIDLELKNPNCKPVYQKPYPVPKSK